MEHVNTTSGEQPGKRRVTVLAEAAAPVTQPDDFHLCPLGLQFHFDAPLEPFTILEVSIEAPDELGVLRRITCSGAVVRCQPDTYSGRHRVWLQFLDLPEPTRERLRCTARNGQLLCSYCQNF